MASMGCGCIGCGGTCGLIGCLISPLGPACGGSLGGCTLVTGCGVPAPAFFLFGAEIITITSMIRTPITAPNTSHIYAGNISQKDVEAVSAAYVGRGITKAKTGKTNDARRQIVFFIIMKPPYSMYY